MKSGPNEGVGLKRWGEGKGYSNPSLGLSKLIGRKRSGRTVKEAWEKSQSPGIRADHTAESGRPGKKRER